MQINWLIEQIDHLRTSFKEMEVCPGFGWDQAERTKAYVSSQIKEYALLRCQGFGNIKEMRLEFSLDKDVSRFGVREIDDGSRTVIKLNHAHPVLQTDFAEEIDGFVSEQEPR